MTEMMHETGVNRDISVAKATIPKLEEKEFYWYQLEGLSVYSCHDQQEQRLGLVTSLLETGANDVLVEKDLDSIDKRERLIPHTGLCVECGFGCNAY